MQSHTFGNSRASVVLTNIINKREDKKLSRSVTVFLVQYHHGLHEIDKIEDKKVRINVTQLWIKSFIESSKKYDTEVGNFVRNVLIIERKKRLR